MPTREEILAELDRRKSASAPGGLSPEAIRAELARRAAMQAAAPSINRPSMGFDPVGEAARGMQKPMMDAMGSAVLGRPLPAPPAPPVDPLAPKGGWLPGQQQQQQARVADPGNPFNPRNAGRPDTGPPPPPDFGTLAEKAAKSVGGMIGGQRPESEAMAQFGGSVVTDPVGAANTAIEVLDPFHQAAYAYNDADAALKAGVTGDWKRAGNELKDLSQSGSFAAMSFLPGAEFAGAPGRMARAAGVAPKAAGAMASAAPEAVAAQVAPKPPQPMFTGPPGPAPSKGNFIVRRADQIVGGAVGATVGGTGDAIAAPGDGGGEEGGPPMGAISGAAIGIFGPRALANASSRGFRAAARPFRGGASFDERVAAKAVREALRSAGIRSADEAAAQMAARYGDKPAAVADLTQEGIGTAAGLSRLPGKTGEAAKARNADLLENRSGRLFTDIEGTTGIDPASVTKSIDDAIRQASEEISPAYEEMFAASRGVNSERLMQLMDDPVVAPYLRRAVQASESLATTAGQAPSNARTWDLVKRGLDRVIEGQIRTSGQAAPELMSARQAVRDELDGLIPEYKSIRDNADAPRMRAARKEGANAMGGRLSVEKVKKIASGLTGRPLTAMQAGMIEQLVPGIEKGQGITALASGRTEQALAAAFGEETARSLISRVRADAALTQNASRINPNVGSVTSQAGMGGGGVGGMIAGAVRAVRNPTEAGLSWLSKSGAYSKQQRDIMGEMLLEGTTPENLQRIFRGRGGPTAPRPQGPPRSAPRPPEKMGFGVGSSKGLRAAAIRYKGKVFSAETHDQALLDAEAAGVPIGKERIEEGFIGSNGKFVDRSDPNAALDALSAGQISDPTFRRMIEDKIRRGEAVSLVSDQVKLGSSKSLPMDEASRMGRRKEWQAEKGPVEDKTWFHSDSQGFDSVDPTKGELGLHVGDKFAADLISHRTKRARRWSSEDGRVAEPNMHEMFVRGNFASAPDLHNFASPLRYLEARMSPSKAAEFDSRYDKMWKQLDEQAREIYSRNGDDPAAWKSWRDAVHTSARDNKISGWEYANQYEAGVSRVIFDPTAARRTDATFDPSQSGSSKLLAGMGASPEAVGGAAGAGIGYFANPYDANDDGVIDDKDRGLNAMGGLVSGVVGGSIAKRGANAMRNITPPKGPPTGPAQATFGGVKAKTADLKLKGIAEQMEKAGASRDQIWKETGWFKGVDGKWRFEIDDSGARLRSNEEVAAIGDSMVQGAKDLEGRVKQSNAALREQPDLFPAALKRVHADMRKRAKGMREKANENFGPTWNEYNGRRLEYDLDHPAMIAAYPQLARDLVISRPGPSQFSPGLMGSYSDSRIKLNGPRNSDQTSTTLHETQHALQEMEDFATGGSPESAYMTDGLRREWAQEIDKILTPAPFEKFAANSVWDGVPEAEVRRQYKAMVDEMRAASKDIYHPLSKTVQHTAAYNIYKRLAGETEARNVQTRRDFTPEERRARPPWTTQDVPDDQQIVRYGSGKQESRPSQSGSSKLLAGMGASPEAVGGIGGGVAGYFGAQDTNDDGVVDASERAAQGLGGLASGVVGAKIARTGVNKARGAFKPQSELMAAKGSYGARPSAMGDLTGHQAAQKQLKELETYRKTAPASEHAAVDQEIADLRGFLEGNSSGNALSQSGFGGPPKPPANALKGPPKKQGPALSRAAEEATREVKAARSAYNRAAQKWVMKDDRELRVKPLEDRVVAAEAKLAQVLKNDARIKTLAARGRSVIESPNVNKPIAYGVGGAAIGAAAISGYNALKPQDRGERPMSPTDPEFYWSTVTADKDKMVPVQLALKEWGEWPDDTEATGINGKVTKAAIKSWRYDRGLDPDAPMTKADTARLLAGPKGYQDRNGKTWRYGADGAPVSPP